MQLFVFILQETSRSRQNSWVMVYWITVWWTMLVIAKSKWNSCSRKPCVLSGYPAQGTWSGKSQGLTTSLSMSKYTDRPPSKTAKESQNKRCVQLLSARFQPRKVAAYCRSLCGEFRTWSVSVLTFDSDRCILCNVHICFLNLRSFFIFLTVCLHLFHLKRCSRNFINCCCIRFCCCSLRWFSWWWWLIMRSICFHNVHCTCWYQHYSFPVADFAMHSFHLHSSLPVHLRFHSRRSKPHIGSCAVAQSVLSPLPGVFNSYMERWPFLKCNCMLPLLQMHDKDTPFKTRKSSERLAQFFQL